MPSTVAADDDDTGGGGGSASDSDSAPSSSGGSGGEASSTTTVEDDTVDDTDDEENVGVGDDDEVDAMDDEDEGCWRADKIMSRSFNNFEAIVSSGVSSTDVEIPDADDGEDAGVPVPVLKEDDAENVEVGEMPNMDTASGSALVVAELAGYKKKT
ncbi:hypothetical protein EW146_g9467 [Bondarzewia mesenterica]|uniref:Uncharacterized protein n=1 Tax=Bondarzewia mesenterica TaxID=1095465 RepID=A0A4S4L7X2_9AGAM|nr:hypothetical protein EW146_g9467 [Bondarzewia mesenterica]